LTELVKDGLAGRTLIFTGEAKLGILMIERLEERES
jgi:hypothetical protein